VANHSVLPNAILGARLWVRVRDGWEEVGQLAFDKQTPRSETSRNDFQQEIIAPAAAAALHHGALFLVPPGPISPREPSDTFVPDPDVTL